MEGRRIFSAVDVSNEVRRAAADHIASLRREFSDLRVGWERPEKLHITVNFAGYLNDAGLSHFLHTAERAAARTSPFTVIAEGTDAFVKRRGANVLWLGLSAPEFAGLAAAFTGDQTKDPRQFNPHLTIARLREPQNSKGLIDRHLASNFGPFEFTAREIVVYESTLLPSGSVYKAVSRYPFGE